MRPPVWLRDVTVRYGPRTALDGVTLTIAAGERVALLGPSGAGKSTLLGVLNGLVSVAGGQVEILGSDPRSLPAGRRRRLQARIGTVQQQLQLVGPLRVVHNVNAGRLGTWSTPRALWSLLRPQGLAEATAALEPLGIADRLHDRTDRLSGGQQQRVALARVLAQQPDLVLADEPVSSLDPALAREVIELLTSVVGVERTVVASLHDTVLARTYFDRLVGVDDGRIAFDLPAADVDDDHVGRLYAGNRR